MGRKQNSPPPKPLSNSYETPRVLEANKNLAKNQLQFRNVTNFALMNPVDNLTFRRVTANRLP